jgi:hypothetical protein
MALGMPSKNSKFSHALQTLLFVLVFKQGLTSFALTDLELQILLPLPPK